MTERRRKVECGNIGKEKEGERWRECKERKKREKERLRVRVKEITTKKNEEQDAESVAKRMGTT